MSRFDELLSVIENQQKGKEYTDVYMVGEQLKDICRENERICEIVLTDMNEAQMSLEKCAAEIKKEADRLHEEKKGSCICIPPDVAEEIIRKFYGIPKEENAEEDVRKASNIINLEDFI